MNRDVLNTTDTCPLSLWQQNPSTQWPHICCDLLSVELESYLCIISATVWIHVHLNLLQTALELNDIFEYLQCLNQWSAVQKNQTWRSPSSLSSSWSSASAVVSLLYTSALLRLLLNFSNEVLVKLQEIWSSLKLHKSTQTTLLHFSPVLWPQLVLVHT